MFVLPSQVKKHEIMEPYHISDYGKFFGYIMKTSTKLFSLWLDRVKNKTEAK